MVTRRHRLLRSSMARSLPLGIAIALLGSTGCRAKPSASDCEQAVRHIIDLEAGDTGAAGLSATQKAELEQQKKALFQTVGTKYCHDEMPVEQVKCAIKARSLAELAETCDKT